MDSILRDGELGGAVASMDGGWGGTWVRGMSEMSGMSGMSGSAGEGVIGIRGSVDQRVRGLWGYGDQWDQRDQWDQ